MDILNFIPKGKDNAITANDLAELTGQTERVVRQQISVARRKNVILNFQDGAGYFIPTSEDRNLVERWKLQEESRLKRHAMALKAARKYLREGFDGK